MLTSEFDYPLPPELIAQRPLTRRDSSRMMVLERARAGFADRRFGDLPGLLGAGDLLVFNNTRVFRPGCWEGGSALPRRKSANTTRPSGSICMRRSKSFSSDRRVKIGGRLWSIRAARFGRASE